MHGVVCAYACGNIHHLYNTSLSLFLSLSCALGLSEPVEKLCSQLQGILSDPRPPPAYPIGYLTSLDRDQWAKLREELCSDAESAKSLSVIDSAMFVVCLDDSQLTSIPEFTAAMLHNYGANRYVPHFNLYLIDLILVLH